MRKPAVPTMPAPNTAGCEAFWDASYHAELKGIPTANTVPAIPREEGDNQQHGRVHLTSHPPSRNQRCAEARTMVNIIRPP